jgi:hypothetical protein
LFKKNP